MTMLRGKFDTNGVAEATEKLRESGLFAQEQINYFRDWARELSDGTVGLSIAKTAVVVGCSETTISSYIKDGKIEAIPDEGWAKFVVLDGITHAKMLYESRKGRK